MMEPISMAATAIASAASSVGSGVASLFSAGAGSAGSLALMEAGATGAVSGGLTAGLPSAAGSLLSVGKILKMAGMMGGLLGAAGGVAQGNADAKTAEYNARVAESQATIAEQNAGMEERNFRRKAGRLLSTQRTMYAKAGVSSSEGTPLLVQEDTASEMELDAQAIRYGGQVAKSRALSQAALDRIYGKQRQMAGYIGAGKTLLTAASDYFGNSSRRL